MVLLEGDGLIEDLYHLLWRKDSPFYQEGVLRVNLPHTIIYKNKKPCMWYFTSTNGSIMRKKFSKLVPEIIEEEYVKNMSKTGIVAYYIYRVPKVVDLDNQPQTIFKTKDQVVREQKNEEIFIRYYNQVQFTEFLNDPNKPDNGVLQKFIDSYGDYNFVIQEVWSPRLCIFTKKVNLKKAGEGRYDMYERAMTFEGSEFYSKNVPLRGGTIPGKLRHMTDIIVQHVSHISFEKWNINRMVAYFKVDPQENVWFLWCTSLRLKDNGKGPQKSRFTLNTPLNVNATFKVPEDIKHLKTNFIDHPVKLQSTLPCITCDRKVVDDELVEVMYKHLVKHEDMQRKHELEKLKRKGKVEIYDAFKAVDQLQGDRVFVRDNKVSIPEIIRKLHPKMKIKEYEAIKDTDAFLYQTTWICEDCFLMISKDLDTGGDNVKPSRASSANKVLVPVKRPFSAQSRYAFRQICLEKNRDYLEATNGEHRNEEDIVLHDFLIQQNLRQHGESHDQVQKRKVNLIETLSSPANFNPGQRTFAKPQSAASSKHPLSATTAADSRYRSLSNMNSFGAFHQDPKNRIPGTLDGLNLDEFESLRTDLASLYGLKNQPSSQRQVASAGKFGPVKSRILSGEISTKRMKRPQTTTQSTSKMSEFPYLGKQRSVNSKDKRRASPLGFDEGDDIDDILNVSLPSDFEIEEEDEGENEDHQPQIKNRPGAGISIIHAPNQASQKKKTIESLMNDDMSEDILEVHPEIDRNQFIRDIKNAREEPKREERSPEAKTKSKMDSIHNIYGADLPKSQRAALQAARTNFFDTQRPASSVAQSRTAKTQHKPAQQKLSNTKFPKPFPLASDDFPHDFDPAARSEATRMLLENKKFFKTVDEKLNLHVDNFKKHEDLY